jgi:hypothetical protein
MWVKVQPSFTATSVTVMLVCVAILHLRWTVPRSAPFIVVLVLLTKVRLGYTVTTVTDATHPPLLIKCETFEQEGSFRGSPVKTLPYGALELFEKNRKEFDKKCAPLALDEIDDLKEFLENANLVMQGDEDYVARACESYPIEKYEAPKDLQSLVSWGADRAKLVLWRERKTKRLNAGILCTDIMEAIRVLILFRFAAKALKTAECVVCGKTFERQRGDRRKTCSSKCRTRKSRSGKQPSQSH